MPKCAFAALIDRVINLFGGIESNRDPLRILYVMRSFAIYTNHEISIRVTPSNRMRYAGYVARMGRIRNAQNVVEKPEEKRPRKSRREKPEEKRPRKSRREKPEEKRPRKSRRENNIKMDLSEIGC
jgi:hypothetical protein